jgi:hypothetical protein
MNSLELLSTLLQEGTSRAREEFQDKSGIDHLLAQLQSRARARKATGVPRDIQLEAIQRFWKTEKIASYRDAYVLSWALCFPHPERDECVLESAPLLERVLNKVDEYKGNPFPFRRCYQGLVAGYFDYDYANRSEERKTAARNNWPILRKFLSDRNGLIHSDTFNPEWVTAAIENTKLFERDPCAAYVDAVLHGDGSSIKRVCELLQIGKASWFQERLVLAQVHKAIGMANREYLGVLDRLLKIDMFVENQVLRDTGLKLLLNRYAEIPGQTLHPGLRDFSVSWWGNPWLTTNTTRWGAVSEEARQMVSDWLKGELIEAFFTKLAEDGLADPRRLNFWKRYVKSMGHIEFALGAAAQNNRESDFISLRKKMKGLIRELEGGGRNNAFIMTMGPLVVVEFGDGGAMYGYEKAAVPFDTDEPLCLPVDARNSLKNRSNAIRETHHGAEGASNAWESNFETILQRRFNISPDYRLVQRSPTKLNSSAPTDGFKFTMQNLRLLAAEHSLEIEDLTAKGGNLWVRTKHHDGYVSRRLTGWGFKYRVDKGWWK